MREKSLGLFGRNKLRRRGSVKRFFVGDYLGVSSNALIVKMLAKHKEKEGSKGSILFCDTIDKINRKGKTQQRIIMLTSAAVYNLGEGGKFKENRRIDLKNISKVSVSKYADNWIVLHVAKVTHTHTHMQTKQRFGLPL